MSEQKQQGPINLYINTPATPQTATPKEGCVKVTPQKEEKRKEAVIAKKTVAFEMYDRITSKKQQAIIAIIGIVLTMLIGAVSLKASAAVGLCACGLLAFSIRNDIAFLKDLEKKYDIKPKQGLF